MKKTKFGREQTWTDPDSGETYPVKIPKEGVEFWALPEHFKNSDRECGKTCGIAWAGFDNLKLFPGKARFIDVSRSRVHLITIINKRRYMMPYELSAGTQKVVAEWDQTKKIPTDRILAKLLVPIARTGTTSGEGTGKGYDRKPPVRRGFYRDERTGKRMKYTIINGDPIKHEVSK